MNELGLSRPATAISIVPQVQRLAIDDRQVMILRGWIASARPVSEVSATIAGEPCGRIAYAVRSPEPSFLETGGGEREYSFIFNVNNLPRRLPRELAVSITAKGEDGSQHEQEFDLELDRGFAWLRGAPRADYPIDIRSPVLLFVERAAIEPDRKLVINGWAVGLAPIVAVQVFDRHGRIGVARIGLPRLDVGQTYHAYPAALTSGFVSVTTLAAGIEPPSQVTVQAIDRSGRAYDMPVPIMGARSPTDSDLRPANPPPPDDEQRRITLHLDEVKLTTSGWLSVVGWCVSAADIARVTVFLDGEEAGEAELGRPRPDVGKAYPRIARAGRSGYRLAVRADEHCDGEYRLRLFAENGLGDSIDLVVPVQAEETDEAPEQSGLPATDDDDYKLHLDLPVLVNGVVRETVTNRLSLNGWAIDRAGVERIEVELDGANLGAAFYGQRRDDLAVAFPDWPGALLSGYALQVPSHVLKRLEPGLHTIDIRMRSKGGAERRLSFAFNSERLAEQPESPLFRTRMTQVERNLHERVLDGLDWHPAFRLVLLVSPEADAITKLAATVAALRRQAYENWTLHLVVQNENGAAGLDAMREGLLATWPDAAERVVLCHATDPELGMRELADIADTPTLFSLLSPGDLLGCDALIEMALASGLERDAEFFYSDESRLDPITQERQPFFKPDWSPDLLLSTNYIGRFWCVHTSLLRRIGATFNDLARYGEYDLVLRCTEAAAKIAHLPKLLCRRCSSTLEEPGQESVALARALARRGADAEILPGAVRGAYRVRRAAQPSGMVSIIIPTIAAHGHIERCIETIRTVTAYRNFEIVLVDNIRDTESQWKPWFRANADKVVEILEPFNWSRFNNLGAAAGQGEFLLFLNDDMEAIDPDWLQRLLEHAIRPEVAVVGPQLLYTERKVQHAGQFLVGLGRSRHAFRYLGENEPGYFGLALTTRNCIAVTGACMMIRRDRFEALGRFDEIHAVVNNDIDFCLRAHKAGYSIIYTPESRLIHHELSSRAELKDIYDETTFAHRWASTYAAGDPFFNPHLSKEFDDFGIDDEPSELVYCGHPVYRREDIKRILAVKLDHIGDFMTCLPAFRRIRERFPAAELYVLAARAARTIAPMEPSIKEVIEFEFFHSKSGLGKKEVTQDDLQALEQRLLPYRFDLAIDLRKHLETRPVLRHTGAQVLAGYDHGCRHPWLDIALEWEPDERLRGKRTHITDDLLRLIDAVATAGETDRTGILPNALPVSSAVLMRLPLAARRLFRKRVVGMHCGAGQDLKLWPTEHFAALIDLLAERQDVNVVLIGSPDEKSLAMEVLEHVHHRRAVASLVGKTALGDLPALLSAFALFVGNDSGPKHIAAGLGVPTVGIHAGSVDTNEWGPAGPLAVAIRRNMSCSPCYLSKLSDCHRSHGCMRGLEPGAVYRVCERLLALRKPARPAAAPLLQPS